MDRRVVILSLFCAGLAAGAPALAGDAGTPQTPSHGSPVKTGKERLSDKASDEQRVDDCNVPPERRGASLRPTGCDHRREPTGPASGGPPAPD